MRIADLPWYDLPALRAATDGWWSGIAGHLRRQGLLWVPEQLSRGGSCRARWARPDLLLSQACGYDVLYDSAALLAPVATPLYAAAGCRGPCYSSEVVVRAASRFDSLESLRGSRLSVNESCSHSGVNALRPLIAPLSRGGVFFGTVSISGSHTASLLGLQQAGVDVACVDVVVLELLRHTGSPLVGDLRTIAVTAPALAPPYVTARGLDAEARERIQNGLLAAACDPALAAIRQTLGLIGFEVLPAAAYRELAAFEEPARSAGYLELPAPTRSPLSQSP